MYNNYNISYEESIKQDLAKSEKLLNDKIDLIREIEFEVNIIKNNIVNLLKNFPDPLHWIDLHEIWVSFNRKTRKFPRDARKAKKDMDFLEKNFFFNKDYDAKLTDITHLGMYESMGYGFTYQIGDLIFVIELPNYKATTIDNYEGMYVQFMVQTSDNVYDVVFRDRYIYDLAMFIDGYLQQRLG